MSGMSIEGMQSSEACIRNCRASTSKWGLLTSHQKRPLETRYFNSQYQWKLGEKPLLSIHKKWGDSNIFTPASSCYFIDFPPASWRSTDVGNALAFPFTEKFYWMKYWWHTQMHKPSKTLVDSPVCKMTYLLYFSPKKCQQLTLVSN